MQFISSLLGSKEYAMKLLTIILALILATMTATALTWDGTTNEGCVNFEPLGSCPETTFPLRPSVSYTNTIREDATAYYFDYNGTDMNLSYIQLKTALVNQSASVLFRFPMSVSTQSQINFSDNNNVGYINSPNTNTITFTWKNATGTTETCTDWQRLRTNISYYYISGQELIIATKFTCRAESTGWTELDSTNITFYVTIKGKTLFINAVANNTNINHTSMVEFETESLYNITIFKQDNFTSSSSNFNEFFIINKSFFYTGGAIMDKGKQTLQYSLNPSTLTSATKVSYWPKGVIYTPKTDGTRNVFNSTYYLTVSNNIMDESLYNKNVQTSKYSILQNAWMYEVSNPYTNSLIPHMNNLSKRYYNYGFDMTNSLLASFVQLGAKNPDISNYTYGISKTVAGSLADNLSALGTKLAMYVSLQDIEPTSPYYNNTNYNGYLINATNHSMCMKNNNGSLMFGWLGAEGQDCAGKHERKIDMLSIMLNNITNDWKQRFLYIDVEGGIGIITVDLDSNSSVNGTLENQFVVRKTLFDWIRTNNLFTYTENNVPIWTAGMIDTGEMTKACCSNDVLKGIAPNWDISQINSKMITYQGYIRRFMYYWNNSRDIDYGTENSDRVQYDRYVAQGIVEQQMLHLDSNDGYSHNIPENLTIMHYYSMRYIGVLQYASTISNISYINNSGAYLSLTQGALQTYDFYNPLVYEEWSNGLKVYANLNRTGWWNLSVNGGVRNLPPNGLYAYIWNDTSFEECFNCDNTSSKIVTPDYVYLYVKEGKNVSFSFPTGWYDVYKFYGDDSTNGLAYVMQANMTSILTGDTLILYSHVAEPSESLYHNITNFTDGTSCTNFTFSNGLEWYTKIINLPPNRHVTNAYLYLKGYAIATISNLTSSVRTLNTTDNYTWTLTQGAGTYYTDASLTNVHAAQDTDTSSYTQLVDSHTAYYNINYSVTSLASNINITTRFLGNRIEVYCQNQTSLDWIFVKWYQNNTDVTNDTTSLNASCIQNVANIRISNYLNSGSALNRLYDQVIEYNLLNYSDISYPSNVSIILNNASTIYNYGAANASELNHTVMANITDFINMTSIFPTNLSFRSNTSGIIEVCGLFVHYLNSLNITIYDENTLGLVTDNITVDIWQGDSLQSYWTKDGKITINNTFIGTYNIDFYNANYSKRSYIINYAGSENKNLNAYLANQTNTVTLTIKDKTTNNNLEGAYVEFSRMLGDSWVVVASKLSDITGKAQFSYASSVKYKINVSLTGYNDKLFYLDPILYSTYTVQLDKNTTFYYYLDHEDMRVYISPQSFWAGVQNNITYGVLSPRNLLLSYTWSICYPGGCNTSTGTESGGEMFTLPFNITGATYIDKVMVNFSYTTRQGTNKYMYAYDIQLQGNSPYTWASNAGKTYGTGLLERLIIVTLIVFVTFSLVAMLAGMEAAAVLSMVMLIASVSLGWLPIWGILPSIFIGLILVMSRSSR
jgi:hypothetical protein